MKNRRRKERRKIPEALGNRACSVWLYVLVLVFDASAHGLLLYSYGFSFYTFRTCFFRLFSLSTLSTILRTFCGRCVLRSAGSCQRNRSHNRKYYMNTVRREVSGGPAAGHNQYPRLSGEHEVIFQTVRDALAAAERYRSLSGAAANVVASDDGIAPLLQGYSDTRQ